MANPNSVNDVPMIGFNGNHMFSDCVLIIVIESDPKRLRLRRARLTDQQYSRVRKLHVNSLVLAEKSPFFHSLFTNATMESGQRCVTLSIRASEESAVMELVNFMHSGTLTATTERALLDVLKLADKFQVVSCMKLCARLLIKTPVNTMSALVYLSLVMADDEVQHLIEAAKQFVATQRTEMQEDENRLEVPNLTLAGIEAILSSDFVGLFSEDEVFYLACEWVKARYPKLEDQRRIFSTHLARHIRFPYMSLGLLKKQVLGCGMLSDELAHKAVVDALHSKITTPLHHYHNDKTAGDGSYRPYGRRVNFDVVVRVVEFEFPRQEIAVYFDVHAP